MGPWWGTPGTRHMGHPVEGLRGCQDSLTLLGLSLNPGARLLPAPESPGHCVSGWVPGFTRRPGSFQFHSEALSIMSLRLPLCDPMCKLSFWVSLLSFHKRDLTVSQPQVWPRGSVLCSVPEAGLSNTRAAPKMTFAAPQDSGDPKEGPCSS